MSRVKDVVARLLEGLDQRLNHWAACALLNRRILLLYDEPTDSFRIDLPSPTYRLWQWAVGPFDE